jgi:hypothetical protein
VSGALLASCTSFSKRLYRTVELSDAQVQQGTIYAQRCGKGEDHVGNHTVHVGVGVIRVATPSTTHMTSRRTVLVA